MKPIKDYEGYYSVSESGHVWSYPKVWGGKTSNQSHAGCWLKPVNDSGYPRVSLYKEGTKQQFHVHRLVAEAFIPNQGNLPEVNHINGLKDDNRVENLEWCTSAQNTRHNILLGKTQRGRKAHFNKLTEDQVRELRKRYSDGGTTHRSLAKDYGIARSAVWSILTGKNWYWLD
jgi:hypothetical protein